MMSVKNMETADANSEANSMDTIQPELGSTRAYLRWQTYAAIALVEDWR
ncbi:hypothetical protein ACQ4M4_21290 [Leptolyngbya sp. AN02str]